MSNPSITYHSNQGTFLLLLCCVCGTCSSVKVCYLFYKVNTIITLYQPGRKGGGGSFAYEGTRMLIGKLELLELQPIGDQSVCGPGFFFYP